MPRETPAVPIPDAPRRVLLVGWDAADLRQIDALAEAGALPELRRSIAAGAVGELRPIGPPIGPIAWTTIATGHRPDRHGILSEFEPDPASGGWRPASVRSRRVKALWNLATQAGLRSVVVGWGASHPAEPILGANVDERFAAISGPLEAAWPIAEASVHPPALGDALAELRLHASEMRLDEIQPFVPSIEGIDLVRDPRPLALAEGLARTSTVHAVATELLEREAWTFAAIRYPLLGHLAPQFLRCRPPGGAGTSHEDVGRYGGVLDAAYALLDAMLARLREIAGPDAVMMLVSDCGMRGDAGLDGWRRPVGLALVTGRGVRADSLIHGAGQVDVAPTVLSLLGLPAGADMPGRILAEAFSAPPADRRIPSWEALAGACGRLPPIETPSPWEQHEAVRQLVALGYSTTDPAEEARNAGVAAQAELHRALVHLEAFEWRAAIDPLRRVVAVRSGDPESRLMLAFALSLVGELAECRALAAAAATEPRLAPFASAVEGLIATAEGRHDDAVSHFLDCERGATPTAFLHDRLGWAHLGLGRLDDAERVLRRSLELDPEGRFAPFGLASIHLDRHEPEKAAEEALRAIGRQYRWPEAHRCLGVALARLGRIGEAVRALETSIAQRPSAAAHEHLAEILERSLKDPKRVAFHRAQADELRKVARR